MSRTPPNHHIPAEFSITDETLVAAARQFSTPLYLYDADAIVARWQLLRSLIPQQISIFYSVKANPNVAIIERFKALGARFEVASGGELAVVRRAGVPGSDVIFVGPGKSRHELTSALESRIAYVVAESPREIQDLDRLARERDGPAHPVPVALRINPGRGKGAVVMGGATQFGMMMEVAAEILAHTEAYPNMTFSGLHAYLATGVMTSDAIVEQTELILQAAHDLQERTGARFQFVDVGGGFGIPYFDRDPMPNWSRLHDALSHLVEDYLKRHPWTTCLAMESGRFLVGPAGVFLATVVDTKTVGGASFAILDGGTSVFGGDERYRGYRPTPVRVVGRQEKADHRPVSLCGPLCTPTDRLAADILLPPLAVGDLVVFHQAGAYGYSASPGLFLSHGFPPEVLCDSGHLTLIRGRFGGERP